MVNSKCQLINVNVMSRHLGSFYAEILGDRVYYTLFFFPLNFTVSSICYRIQIILILLYGFKYSCLIQKIITMVRVFANGPVDLCSISDWVIPKTQKMVLDDSLLNTQHYKVRIRGKWSNPGKGIGTSPTPQCSSYWTGSLQVALDDGWPTY